MLSRRDVTDDVSVQPYTEMQKSMMDELDKRRDDWEKEMQRMQEDFFKVRLYTSTSSYTYDLTENSLF